jgi:hypothetical protein
MTYETTNQHPTNGDFGGTNLDAANWTTFFTGDCDECSFVGQPRQSSMQAEDDLDEHKAVAHAFV